MLLTGGVVLSDPVSILKSSYNDSPLGIGIIGTGSRGKGLASLLKDVPSIKLVACSDILPFHLKEAMQYGDADTRAYEDYHALLDDKKVDAVIIATPFGTHAEIALKALEADKHVFCEKTMSYGFGPTKELVQKSRSSGKIFQTGHQYHSSKLYHHVHNLIKSGYIGEVAHIESQWNRNGDWRRKVPDPKWEKLVNWRMYRDMSGGLTAELCSHQIDFVNWITDAHPVKVAGFGGIDYWKDGRETYDNVHLVTEYPNGLKATFTSLTTNAKDDYLITVRGNKGTIVLDYTKAWLYAEHKRLSELGIVDGVSGATRKAWQSGEGSPINVTHADPSLQALLDFEENIRKNKTPLSNAETGAKVSVVVQMALNAMDNNTVEYWKEEYNF